MGRGSQARIAVPTRPRSQENPQELFAGGERIRLTQSQSALTHEGRLNFEVGAEGTVDYVGPKRIRAWLDTGYEMDLSVDEYQVLGEIFSLPQRVVLNKLIADGGSSTLSTITPLLVQAAAQHKQQAPRDPKKVCYILNRMVLLEEDYEYVFRQEDTRYLITESGRKQLAAANLELDRRQV